MKSIKSLKPSMREKKRYLLLKGRNLKENVEKAILDFIGVLGMSKAGLEFIKSGADYSIVAVNRESVDHVRASFVMWPEKIDIVDVSGSLKKLKG